ncbi:PH domain-containing protein [Nocardioides mesophilus]|uniref:PH domain-containing protein n=1 Tax=Nocardioides mesophilus TaxID=433659 RepID=A0A7G9R6J3_9ACTN|nr:PH domain-containing protein [Nocardioides mesophilus]QNN51218.1 PH domain-containing protein [Nocardioides mesophilus]
MDDLFAPPGTPWRRVSPALGRVRRIVLAGVVGGLAVAVLLLGWLGPLPGLVTWPVLGLLVLVLVGGWVFVGRSVARWGYAERDEDLYITHGAWVRRLVVVPYGRMQYVDVHAGPLDRAFGVATVRLHTASPATSAHVPGLPADEAARLRDRLTSLGEAQAAGL